MAQELDRLLNTRCAASLEQLATRPRSVLDYGLPDYSPLYSADIKHRRQLSDLVRDTIVAFEPRLREVAVDVVLDANSRHALEVSVSARLVAAGRLQPVSFNVAVRESA